MVHRAALVAALVTACAASAAAYEGTMHVRSVASRAAQALDYTAIVRDLGDEQQMVGARHSGDVSRLDGDINRAIGDLQRRTSGAEHSRVMALAQDYREAAGERRVAALGRVQARAESILRERQAEWAAQAGSSATTIRSVATLVSVVGAVGLVVCLFVLVKAPIERRRHARELELERLSAAAYTDNLTGLGNHRAFHHDLSQAIRRRAATGSSFSLMAIDLDGLKQINDTKGHQAGDQYIRQVAEILSSALKGDGTVFRTGGDEFMALLPDRRNWHALAASRAIEQQTHAMLGRRAVSIGVTESIENEARHLLIHQADVALYEAKRTKLAAVTYHPSLARVGEAGNSGPSPHQKALAAALARAVDAKDAGTRGHSETVAALAAAIGTQLGIRGDSLERLRLAGLLHDVGKIGVPDIVLQKSGPLSADEAVQMREHVSVGHAILHAAEMPIEAGWVLHHHERYDGTGYPTGLHGDDIPIASRVIAVADAFEAITGNRPYRESKSAEEALEELRRHVGTQFDGRCVCALAEVIEQGSVMQAIAADTDGDELGVASTKVA